MRFRPLFGLALIAAFAFFGVGVASAQPLKCPDAMKCRTVSVPLDRSGERPGRLKLELWVGKGKGPVIFLLAGGPGQSATQFAEEDLETYAKVAPGYRIAVLNQRGTGSTAIRCGRLQRLGLSDLTVRPRGAVRACGDRLGPRRADYSSASSVLDIEAARRAIGAKKVAIYGVSYGTYVATKYARKFPSRVRRLILDSVVPQENIDPFMRPYMKRIATVLRSYCGGGRCGFGSDPAEDLARLVAEPPHRGRVPGKKYEITVNGPNLLDWLTSILSFEPGAIEKTSRAIHRASRGDYRGILKIGDMAKTELSARTTAFSHSWGLHAATLCSDLTFPYSVSTGYRASRLAATKAYLADVPDEKFWPFDRATAIGNGVNQMCLDWRPTEVGPAVKPGIIEPPTLILAGKNDVSTPIEYARRELAWTRRGRMITFAKTGHSVATSKPCAMRVIGAFLRDPHSRGVSACSPGAR